MMLMVTFALLVLFYSLISGRLEKTVITAPLLFTIFGAMLALLVPVVSEVQANRKLLLELAEVGLVMTLFTDATRVKPLALRKDVLSLRLLGIGMLPSIILGAMGAALILPELSLWEACIVGTILAPTDAGLGEVVVSSPQVPQPVRQALSVEAGLNDGMAVPFLMFFMALAHAGTQGAGAVLTRFVGDQLGVGVLTGVLVGGLGGLLLGKAKEKAWMLEGMQQLGLIILPLLCVLSAKIVGGSMFISAYVSGIFVQIWFKDVSQHSVEFTEGWGRLLVFLVFFIFGLFAAMAANEFSVALAMYALVSLTAVRMIPVAMSLWGTGLSTPTVLFMGWFGPRGLASIVLGMVYLEQEGPDLPGEPTIRLAVIVAVLMSVVAHGLSASPGIAYYSRKVAGLHPQAPEKSAVLDVTRTVT